MFKETSKKSEKSKGKKRPEAPLGSNIKDVELQSIEDFEAEMLQLMGEGWFSILREDLLCIKFRRFWQYTKGRRNVTTVYPPIEDVFSIFRMVPIEKIKVVVVGQDPYHQPNQAMGMAFSVNEGVAPPPSLCNMYKELGLSGEYGPSHVPKPSSLSGNLTSWADQGVFLLNRVLTVEKGLPQSHAKGLWSVITGRVVEEISNRGDVIFMLWGRPAQTCKMFINTEANKGVEMTQNHILEAGHPSPLSVRYFLGCNHFTKANTILSEMGKETIDWRIQSIKEGDKENGLKRFIFDKEKLKLDID